LTDLFKDIGITGVDKAGVTQPTNDGTRGSGLYKVPFKLSERPPTGWDEFFVNAWDHPESYSTMHRPRIARVVGDKIVLDGTTMEEVEKVRESTLEGAVARANREYRDYDEKRAAKAKADEERAAEHQREVDEVADRLKFEKKE
jgi:hypothetical protein